MGGSTASGAAGRGDVVARSGLLLVGVLLIGANLRAAITSVGPVLGDIRTDLGIGGATASILISMPLVAFGLISPLAPPVARRMGIERALGGSLLLLAVAIVVRSVPFAGAIWIGTALLGVAIAMLNVLLPALIKRDYPDRIGGLTGLYSAVQSGFAAVAAGLAVPIAGIAPAGWRLSLGVWAGLAVIGLAVFLPQLRARSIPSPDDVDVVMPGTGATEVQEAPAASAAAPAPPARRVSMWSSALAWQVTLFLGLQSTVYYVAITWWPSIESAHGVSAAAAGWHQFAFQVLGIGGTLIAAATIERMRDQRTLIVSVSGATVLAIAGEMLLPDLSLLWVLVIGATRGAAIVTGLSLFGLRTRDHHHAASLSGMAQSVGYLIAAAGPIVLGMLHDLTGSWEGPLGVLVVVSIAELVFGTLAGRHRFVEDRALAR